MLTDTADKVPLERVETELCTLAGQLAAATCRFLQLLAEFDARRGWAQWELRSCAHWLSWRCGMDLRTAREHVRVARSLAELPRIRAAFAEGRLSYSKVRAVARVATEDNEDDLLQAALHSPASQLERLTRGLRRAARASEADEEHQPLQPPHRVSWRWDDDGSLVMWGRLSAEDGARLLAGLTRAEAMVAGSDLAGAPEVSGSPENGSAEPSRPRADLSGRPPHDLRTGLVAMAEVACSGVAPRFAPAAEMLVHADADELARAVAQQTPHCDSPDAGEPAGRVDDGPPLTASVLSRLLCDSGIRLVVRSRAGRTLDIGRRSRRPTRRQLLALWQRDRGCIMPGCEAARFLHAHHVVPWARGGSTTIDNLVLLCGHHHRALHDGAFTIVARSGQRFDVLGAGGAARPAAPPVRGSADALTAAHPGVTPETLTPDWDGAGLDLAHAVGCYLEAWQLDRNRRRSDQSELVSQP